MAAALGGALDFASSSASFLPDLSNFNVPRIGSADPNTYIRISVGATENTTENMGGNVPGVSLWNIYGQAIGYTVGNKKLALPGSAIDIVVEPRREIGNVQANYMSITNGGVDALCIAGVALSFPDGGKAGFSTNVAAACGAMWSYSRTNIIGTSDSGGKNAPKCVWIDRDGTNGIPHQGMAFHLPSFNIFNRNLAKSYSENLDLMCKSTPRFHMYEKLITEDSIRVFEHPPEFIPGTNASTLTGRDKDPSLIIGVPGVLAENLRSGYRDVLHDRRRSSRPRTCRPVHRSPRRPLAEQVVISPLGYTSARELCESRNSFGHSFVSLAEQLFCDMIDKSLYHTCNGCVTSCCFDVKETSFRACQKDSTRPLITRVNGTAVNSALLRSRQVGDVFASHWTKDAKTFSNVQRW